MLKTGAIAAKFWMAFVVFLLGGLTLHAQSANASSVEKELGLQPLKQLVSWFPQLVATFDRFVHDEERKQFIRRLEELAKSLQSLESRKIEFNVILEATPSKPDKELKTKIGAYHQSLTTWLEDARRRVLDVSAALVSTEQAKGREVARLLNEILAKRASQIPALEAELRHGLTTVERVKANNLVGMEVLRATRESIGTLIAELRGKPVAN
jgi:hypothetical protein